jgi:hypothetical protein
MQLSIVSHVFQFNYSHTQQMTGMVDTVAGYPCLALSNFE